MGQCTSRKKKKKIRREDGPVYAEPIYLAMRAYNPINATSLVDDDNTSPKYLEMRDYAHRNENSSNDNMPLIDIGNAYAVSSPFSIDIGNAYAVSTPLLRISHVSDSTETSSRDESNIPSTDSAYSDETCEERKTPKIATKTNVSSHKNNGPCGENYRLISHDLESMVEIFREEIEETVDARRILPHLTFISRSDEDELLHSWRESSVLSMKKLIDKIKALREEGKWEVFVVALEREGYECIVQDLRGVPQEDFLEKRTLVRIFALPLIKQIHAYEVAQHLHTKGVISQSDKEVIERKYNNDGPMQGARELLRCLSHCSSKWFEQFCDALKECGHNDLFELLSSETTEPTGKNSNEADSSYLTPIFSEPETADNDVRQSLSIEFLDTTIDKIRRKEEKLKTEKELLESIKELNITIAVLEENLNGPSFRSQEELQRETTDTKDQVDIGAKLSIIIAEKLEPILKELAALKLELQSMKGQLVPSSHPRRMLYRSENDPMSSSGYNSSSHHLPSSHPRRTLYMSENDPMSSSGYNSSSHYLPSSHPRRMLYRSENDPMSSSGYNSSSHYLPSSHPRKWLYRSENDPMSSSGYNSSSHYLPSSHPRKWLYRSENDPMSSSGYNSSSHYLPSHPRKWLYRSEHDPMSSSGYNTSINQVTSSHPKRCLYISENDPLTGSET